MHWVRYKHAGTRGFGQLSDGRLSVCRGDMFTDPTETGESLELDMPCVPSKLFALWNNFHEAAAKFEFPIPDAPLYFLKGANSFCAHGSNILPPRSDSGLVIYEGELGIVIGKQGKDISLEDAPAHIFGYTCVNDVTALTLLDAVPDFVQWTRAKSFDTFTPFGPQIAVELDLGSARVRTAIDGTELQNYPLADMIFAPAQLVSLISRDVTLVPGDMISCGTSVGMGPLPLGALVEVTIDGIGTLSNRYFDQPAGA